ncbi:protein phosphatase/bis(5'-nucleosyl)-tetraphosphatase (symmetrical) [Thalassobacillus cyri]|uniref:Protein phosphatase/bis(5'-nucleosyl)-tetraphosphatase (Symmetrical) n=1 Tax=Thalassobacillus cyri TaxID=571932 RepID=A0A1H3VN97_9BACI|nr:bis(5'-nucleosyl)-tetraphosphatase PrpE [Thalassobacillus cyri]SDZ75598.1 protein phosphatase/bis(5'-nucleosyl)-tetraphosphatase (symmetrical) [Thalassobacillus cyri]
MKVDIIGDVHGCLDEMKALFHKLGYEEEDGVPVHPDGRIPIFLGDITDRGPDSIGCIRYVYKIVVGKNKGRYVPGNHCNKLYRFFLGNKVQEKHGLETTTAEYRALPSKEQKEVRHHFMKLYEEAPLYLELREANAIVAHAGIKESFIGQQGKKVRTFVLYGDITGEKHEDGRPVRRDWAQAYEGSRWIVYGHTPVREPRFVNNTVNIDTGCVFGNKLTAFRLPEEEIVSVSSKQPFVEEKFRLD